MFNISTYLEKFQKIEPEGESVKRAAKSVILETFGVCVEKKDMAVRNGVLHISTAAALKNEIFMNKRGILKKTQETSRERSLGDIR
jgi:hypothetical protein